MLNTKRLDKNSDEYKIITSISIEDYLNKIVMPDMPWYFDESKIDFDFKPTTRCPLHNEDTASFRNYYNEENGVKYTSFYCFGCGKGGTVINLHMYYVEVKTGHKISYGEAIKNLKEMFSDKLGTAGNDKINAGLNKIAKMVPKGAVAPIEQDKADLYEFDSLYLKIDKILQVEDIELSKKKVMYKGLDDAIRLVRDNKIEAKKGTKYLEDLCDEYGIYF
jgi:hypothetical protein